MIQTELFLIISAVFLLLSILVSKFAVKSGIPVLLLFLLLGMLAGSDGPGGIYFDYPWLAQTIGVIALAFILFSGGLDTSWQAIRPVLRHGLLLSTVGVVVTAVSVGWFTHEFLNFSWVEGVLLGAIIAATDAAAVFSILRGKNIHLRGRLKPLLELESGSNDPMAVFLTIGMTQILVDPSLSIASLVPLFIQQMGIGAVFGYISGRSALFFINRLRLEYDGLYPVLTIALVLLTYGAAASVGGNGFLAVYLAGTIMARHDFIHKRSLLNFHDGIAWLMQIAMFVTLGLQVFPSQLPGVALAGMQVALFLIFVARPVSVFVALAFTGMKLNKKLFVSWVGLRGAAPIVLATFPLLAGLDQAGAIFNLVFFIVLTSALLQGTLLLPAARLLRVAELHTRNARSPLAYVMRDGVISNDVIEVTIAPDSRIVGKQILELGLPKNTLIMLIGRTDDLIVPRGDTVIEANDKVLILTDKDTRDGVCQLLETDEAAE